MFGLIPITFSFGLKISPRPLYKKIPRTRAFTKPMASISRNNCWTWMPGSGSRSTRFHEDQRELVTDHLSLGYFAKQYGLNRSGRHPSADHRSGNLWAGAGRVDRYDPGASESKQFLLGSTLILPWPSEWRRIRE